MFSEKFDMELPEGMVPYSAIRLLNSQTHVNFSDHEDSSQRNSRMRLIHFIQSLNFNMSQMENMLDGVRLRNGLQTTTLETEPQLRHR